MIQPTYSVAIPAKTRHNNVEGKENADAVENKGQIDGVAFVLWTTTLLLLSHRKALNFEFSVCWIKLLRRSTCVRIVADLRRKSPLSICHLVQYLIGCNNNIIL